VPLRGGVCPRSRRAAGLMQCGGALPSGLRDRRRAPSADDRGLDQVRDAVKEIPVAITG
jgi:hypothetical protein